MEKRRLSRQAWATDHHDRAGSHCIIQVGFRIGTNWAVFSQIDYDRAPSGNHCKEYQGPNDDPHQPFQVEFALAGDFHFHFVHARTPFVKGPLHVEVGHFLLCKVWWGTPVSGLFLRIRRCPTALAL